MPIVYNTGGCDSLEALRLLDDMIDIYMPDIKYGFSETARQYSKVRDYVEVNQAAVKEIHRQVGDLILNDEGLAQRGLLVRHLVLTGLIEETEEVMRFLSQEISLNSYLNVMAQYHPCYRADEYLPLNQPLSPQDYQLALQLAAKYRLFRLD